MLTGDPGCGKTTVIRRVVERLRDSVRMQGFYTEEIREHGRRAGFRGVTLAGESFPLAAVGRGSYQVGPYAVDLDGLEKVGVPELKPQADTELIVLDEIGKMESFSEGFRQAVLELLEGDVPLLATVAQHGVGFVKKVRHRPGVTLIKMTRRSRDGMVGEIVRRLAKEGVRCDANQRASRS